MWLDGYFYETEEASKQELARVPMMKHLSDFA